MLLDNICCYNGNIVSIETILGSSGRLTYKRESPGLILINPRDKKDHISLVTILQRKPADSIIVVRWWDKEYPKPFGRLSDHRALVHRNVNNQIDFNFLHTVAKKYWRDSAIGDTILHFPSLCP